MLKSIKITATEKSTVNGVTTITKNVQLDYRDIVKSIRIYDGNKLVQSVNIK